MPIGYKGQSSFNGGEITPELGEKTDLQRYYTSVKTMLNGFCKVYGGWSNRAGTYFTGRTLDDTKNSRCVPFSFSTTQTYMLIFSHETMMVVKDGGLVLEASQNITAITKANPGVVTSAAHGRSNGDIMYLASIGGMTQLNGRFVKLAGVTTDTYQLKDWDGNNIDTTNYTTYTSGGTASKLFVLTTPYDHEDLDYIKFTQSADVMTLTHPDYDEKELSRTGHASWSLDDIEFNPQIAAPSGSSGTPTNAGAETYLFQITAVDEITGEESLPESISVASAAVLSQTNTIKLTIAAVAGANKYNIYRRSNGVYGFIGSSNVSGSNVFTDNFIAPDLDDTPPTARDPLNDITDNHAGAVAYHQQRRIFGGSNSNPQTHYGTQLGNFYNMNISSPIKDSDAYTLTLASNTVNRIRHFISLRDLVILTNDSAWAVRPGSNADVITATANQVQQSEVGSSDVRPIVAFDIVLFVEETGKKVYDMGYTFDTDTYKGIELSLLASHLLEDNYIKDWAFARRPFSIVYSVRDDGILLGMTYLKEEQIVGWHRHDTDGYFESIGAVREGKEDALYFIVNRQIEGVTRRYIERLHSRNFKPLVEDAFFVDCGLTLDTWNKVTTSTMTLSGGTEWKTTETLTLTENAVASPFSSADIGKVFFLRVKNSDGTIKKRARVRVVGYTSPTVVTVKPVVLIPTELRSVATTHWARTFTDISGLDHIEGKEVSMLADGDVLPRDTVVDGAIDLPDPVAKIHVGIPYTSVLELLDIDVQELGNASAFKQKTVAEVMVSFKDSRGGKFTSAYDGEMKSYEFIQRIVEDGDNPIPLQTGREIIEIEPRSDTTGHLAYIQEDPLPVTITAIRPKINAARND